MKSKVIIAAILILCLALFANCHDRGQNNALDTSDNVNTSGKNLSEILSDDWEIADSIYGDINRDGVKDLVFFATIKDYYQVEDEDAANEFWDSEEGLKILQENNGEKKAENLPYDITQEIRKGVFGIYFGNKEGLYTQWKIFDQLIPMCNDKLWSEYYGSSSITDDGALEITVGEEGSYNTYVFRCDENKFRLVEQKNYIYDSSYDVCSTYNLNFVTGKTYIENAELGSDKIISKRTETIPDNRPKYLGDFQLKPFEFDIDENTYDYAKNKMEDN